VSDNLQAHSSDIAVTGCVDGLLFLLSLKS